MKVTSVRKEDRGTYYCVADNGVSRGDRRSINLEVEFSPVITTPNLHLGQALHNDMDIECHIESYPSPAIVWVKDDIILKNSQHYKISNVATADRITDSTLQIITIEKCQYGDYKCKAVNKLGSDEAKIHLFETVSLAGGLACGQAHYSAGKSLNTTSTFLIMITLIAFFKR